jgi:multicomponent Na+:H+ antiporter subunit D
MFILLGTAYIFMATGTLNFAVLATQMPRVPPEALSVIAACLLIGLSLKIGAFPFHFWLPDAHSSARTAISALLSGVMIKVSIYALIRVSFLFFYQSKPEIFTAIAALGTLSILGGHILAYRQRDIKRLLAYSTVAQIGYILVGIGSATAAGVTAAVFHAFGHMVMKSGLFITAGHLADDMKTREIPEMKGLFRFRPRFVTVFSLLAAGIVGIPPLAGFMGKWFLMLASTKAGNILPALALGVGTVISAAYYLRVLKSFFAPGEEPSRQRPAFWPLAVSGTLAACCIILGIVPFLSPLWELFASIGDQTLDVAGYIAVVSGR